MKLKKLLKIGLPILGVAALAVTLPVALTSCSNTAKEATKANTVLFTAQNQENFIKAINGLSVKEITKAKVISLLKQNGLTNTSVINENGIKITENANKTVNLYIPLNGNDAWTPYQGQMPKASTSSSSTSSTAKPAADTHNTNQSAASSANHDGAKSTSNQEKDKTPNQANDATGKKVEKAKPSTAAALFLSSFAAKAPVAPAKTTTVKLSASAQKAFIEDMKTMTEADATKDTNAAIISALENSHIGDLPEHSVKSVTYNTNGTLTIDLNDGFMTAKEGTEPASSHLTISGVEFKAATPAPANTGTAGQADSHKEQPKKDADSSKSGSSKETPAKKDAEKTKSDSKETPAKKDAEKTSKSESTKTTPKTEKEHKKETFKAIYAFGQIQFSNIATKDSVLVQAKGSKLAASYDASALSGYIANSTNDPMVQNVSISSLDQINSAANLKDTLVLALLNSGLPLSAINVNSLTASTIAATQATKKAAATNLQIKFDVKLNSSVEVNGKEVTSISGTFATSFDYAATKDFKAVSVTAGSSDSSQAPASKKVTPAPVVKKDAQEKGAKQKEVKAGQGPATSHSNTEHEHSENANPAKK
ncbi:hypothetical protein [Ureaplasma ceti]|uniref:Uncharacterized protein n=1 Tax=Ureaplasma ceti TaxID=3119530 RepID=A0ABP9U5K8_9BACT